MYVFVKFYPDFRTLFMEGGTNISNGLHKMPSPS